MKLGGVIQIQFPKRIGAIVIAFTLASCGDIKFAPLMIEADGTAYLACRNYVRIFSDETGNGVSFTDSEGLDHTLRGIKSLATSELPATVEAAMPFFPDDAAAVDEVGKEKYRDGAVYYWAAGAQQARRRGSAWVPVRIPNDACKK